jgi:short-subunit dehydrogenase
MKVDWATTTAVVTGASSGIGRAVVQALTERGVSVGAIARCGEDLVALRGANAGQGRVEVVSADVSVRAEAEAAVDSLRDRLGPIGVLINNAGVGLCGPVARLALEHPRVETTVPAALRFAVRLRHLVPRVFPSATRRAFRAELAGLGPELGRPGNRSLDPAGGRP